MSRLFRILLAIISIALLTGCVVPENFELELTAQPDQLHINYDGQLIIIDIFANKDKMQNSDKAAMLKAIDEGIRNDTQEENGTYKSEYSLDGVMDIQVDMNWPYAKMKRHKNFGNTFDITNKGEGVFVIESTQIKPGDQNYFKSLGMDLDDISGDVSFVAQEGIAVLEHNADSEPGIFSEAYKWDLDMGRGEALRLVIEIESVKRAIAEERARKEGEKRKAQAAYEARIKALSNEYDNQLIEYFDLVSTARTQAQQAYKNIQFSDLECSYFTKKGFTKRIPYRYYFKTSCTVKNNTRHDLTIYRYQLELSDSNGQPIYTDEFRLSDSNLAANASTQFNKEFRLSVFDENEDLRTKLHDGNLRISVAPVLDKIYLDGDRLKPDGSPFLPKRPHPDYELEKYAKKGKGYNYDYESERHQALVKNGSIPDLPPTPKDFGHPPNRIIVTGTSNSQPATSIKAAKNKETTKSEPVKTVQTKSPPAEGPTDISNNNPKESEQLVAQSITAETWVEPATGIKFVQIPAGCFEMGSPDTEKGRESNEGPLHKVCVDSFWMSKFEVTNAEYAVFDPKHKAQNFHGYSLNSPKQPVVYVSWNDAKEYVAWLSSTDPEHEFRLPTEAEWEYAARAGTSTARYWGDEPNKANGYANTADIQFKKLDKSAPIHRCDDSYVVSAPIGQYEPNRFGLYDMLGNVWEWCEDSFDDGAYGTHSTNNPINLNGTGGKVLRGGSWRYGPDNVRSAQRADNKSGDRQANIGFRVVRIEKGQGPAFQAATGETSSNPVQELGDGLKKLDGFLKSLSF